MQVAWESGRKVTDIQRVKEVKGWVFKGRREVEMGREMICVPPSAMESTLLLTSQSVILSAGMGLFTPLVAAW